jgi:hypothetical protein
MLSTRLVELRNVIAVTCEFMHKEVDSEQLKMSKEGGARNEPAQDANAFFTFRF